MAAVLRNGQHSIYLIQPKFPASYWGQEHFLKLTPYGAVYPPLGLLTLAGRNPELSSWRRRVPGRGSGKPSR